MMIVLSLIIDNFFITTFVEWTLFLCLVLPFWKDVTARLAVVLLLRKSYVITRQSQLLLMRVLFVYTLSVCYLKKETKSWLSSQHLEEQTLSLTLAWWSEIASHVNQIANAISQKFWSWKKKSSNIISPIFWSTVFCWNSFSLVWSTPLKTPAKKI